MRRREFVALLGGAAVASPLAVSAQQRTPRVGVLRVGAAAAPRDLELARRLSRIGYVEGRNSSIRSAVQMATIIGYRNSPGLTGTNPDVIVGSTTAVAIALAAATLDIPIVMAVIRDPIALGQATAYAP